MRDGADRRGCIITYGGFTLSLTAGRPSDQSGQLDAGEQTSRPASGSGLGSAALTTRTTAEQWFRDNPDPSDLNTSDRAVETRIETLRYFTHNWSSRAVAVGFEPT